MMSFLISIPFSTIKSVMCFLETILKLIISIPFSTIKSVMPSSNPQDIISISIPFSTIKRHHTDPLKPPERISIPFSTIKRRYTGTAGYQRRQFQFHLVRLKVQPELKITVRLSDFNSI